MPHSAACRIFVSLNSHSLVMNLLSVYPVKKALSIFFYDFLTIFYGSQSSGSEVEIAVAPAFNACFISSSDRISPPAMIGVPVV